MQLPEIVDFNGSLFKVESTKEFLLEVFSEDIGQIEKYGYQISNVYDLFPWLESIRQENRLDQELSQTLNEVAKAVAHIAMLDLESSDSEDPLIHNRRSVLVKTNKDKKALVSVAFYDESETGWHFGGAGIYPIPENTVSVLGHSMHHSEQLAYAMRKKAYEIGVADHLAGSKTIIAGEDWKEDESLQILTGILFSPAGPWPQVITGSDAYQTEKSIANMELGSRIGGGVGQIVGTEYGLPNTAGYVRHTMESTYLALGKYFPEFNLPNFNNITAGIQGIGKVGMTTAEMFLDKGSPRIFVTDIALFPDSASSSNIDKSWAQHITENILSLIKTAAENNQQVIVVHPNNIWYQQMNIFCPCSSTEHLIDISRINDLYINGVKVILSGANNPLSTPNVASYAHSRGILIPPPELSNGGSATSAAFEPHYLRNRNKYSGSDEFVTNVLIPHINNNAFTKMSKLREIIQRGNVSSLVEAGDIASLEWRSQQISELVLV